MLHAASSTTPIVGNGIISNKLHSASILPTDDQKDPEPEREATVDVDEAEIETNITASLGPSKVRLEVTEAEAESAPTTTSEQSLRGLSLRASKMGEFLRASHSVSAVLLRADGSAKEISYDATASQTREIVGGRARIVGSIEGLDALIICAQSSSRSRSWNEHSLPGDVEGGHRGDYLIFRADAEGNAADLSVSEYQLFAAANPSTNSKSAQSIDAQRIRARPQNANLIFVRSEIDREIREEFAERSADESEIEQAKEQRFGAIVERIVADLSSSPLDDPNFDIADETELEREIELESAQSLEIVGRRIAHRNVQTDDVDAFVDSKSSTDWPIGALCFLRNYGRSDGADLAQRIESEFADAAPSNAEMAQILRAVEHFEANVDAVNARGAPEQSALDFALELEAKMSGAAPCDLVEMAQSIVEKDLVTRAKALLRRILGREGRDDELRQTVRDIAVKMAEAAIEFDCEMRSANAKKQSDDESEREENDESESEAERESEALRTTATFRSRSGSAQTFSVYFGAESKRANVSAALRSFRKRNRRAPSAAELSRLCRFLTTLDVDDDDDLERESEAAKAKEKVLVTPIRTTKTRSAAFSVYFDENARLNSEAQSERIAVAVQWFERFNGRAPDDSETAQLRELLTVPDSAELREFIVPNDVDVDAFAESKSKSATAFTLSFDDDAEHGRGDEETAVLWFERFNQRKPNREERRKICAFLKL